MDNIFKLNRGDIVYVELGQHPGSSIQSGRRPCVVVSCSCDNNIKGNPIINVCPCTTKYEKRRMKTHVLFRREDVEGYLAKSSLILVEQSVPADKNRIICKVGKVINDKVMKELDEALLYRFSLMREGACGTQ